MSSQVTEDARQSHVDLDGVQAIVDGRVHLHEVRVHEALLRNELRGLRAIERASGLSRESVLNAIPSEAAMRTALLYRSAQGKYAWDPEERELMRIEPRRYTSSSDHRGPLSFWRNKSVQEPLGPSEVLEDSEGLELLGRQMTRIEELLDPSLDIWANTGGPMALGDAGWALAMVTRFRPRDLTLAEIGVICRLGVRQVQRLVERLTGLGWASKVKVGRSVLVTVDFSLMAHEDLIEGYLKTARKAHKARQHGMEAEAVEDMATQRGRRVREMWKNRRQAAEEIRRLLEGVPERLRHRVDRLLRFLDSPEDRRDRRWLSRWEGERVLRECLS